MDDYSNHAPGAVRYHRCPQCGHAQAGSSPYCTRCGATPLQSATSAGLGTLMSFTVVHRAPSEAFRARVPYTIALVDMDEGFRLMLNLPEGEAPALGRRVRVWASGMAEGDLLCAELLP